MVICIFAIFYVFGIVANRKRKAINNKLKEKKTYDIESGREAAIAAMESKQVLDVAEDEQDLAQLNDNPNATLNAAVNNGIANQNEDPLGIKKEEVPSVMVLNSTDSSNQASTAATSQNQPQVQQPLVIDTSSVQ